MLSKDDLQQIKDESLPLWKLQRAVIHDVWMRSNPYTTRSESTFIQIPVAQEGIIDDDLQNELINSKLWPYMFPAGRPISPEDNLKLKDMLREMLYLEEKSRSKLVSSTSRYVYYDYDRRQQIEGSLVEKHFDENNIKTDPNRSIYKIFLKVELPMKDASNYKLEMEDWTLTPVRNTSNEFDDLFIMTDRLDLVPGISGYAISKSHPQFDDLIGLAATHPLSSNLQLKFVELEGIEPNVIQPIFSRNHPNFRQSESPIISHDARIVHGFPDLVSIMKLKTYRQYTIEETVDLVKNYLSGTLGDRFSDVKDSSFEIDKHIIPGKIERIKLIDYKIEIPGLQKQIQKSRDELNWPGSTELWTEILQHGPSQLWITLSDEFSFARVSQPWIQETLAQLFQRLTISKKTNKASCAIRPYVLSGDKTIRVKEFWLLFTLFKNRLHELLIVPKKAVDIENNDLSDWTLKNWNSVLGGKSVAQIGHKIEKSEHASAETMVSLDTSRALLLELIGDKTDKDEQVLLEDAGIETSESVLAALNYLARKHPRILTESRTKLELTRNEVSGLEPYEQYVISTFTSLMKEYLQEMEKFNYAPAKRILDRLILFFVARYVMLANCDLIRRPSYAKRIGKVYANLASLLMSAVYPIYPVAAADIYKSLIQRLITPSDDRDVLLYQLPDKSRLPKVDNVDVIEGGKLTFLLIDTIENVIRTTNIPREKLRIYVSVNDSLDMGYFDYDYMRNQSGLRSIGTITNTLFSVTNRPSIRNSGRVKSIKVGPVTAHFFDDRQWVSRDGKVSEESEPNLQPIHESPMEQGSLTNDISHNKVTEQVEDSSQSIVNEARDSDLTRQPEISESEEQPKPNPKDEA